MVSVSAVWIVQLGPEVTSSPSRCGTIVPASSSSRLSPQTMLLTVTDMLNSKPSTIAPFGVLFMLLYYHGTSL